MAAMVSKKSAYHILRIGLGITFLWIGVLIVKDPVGWGGYIQPWAARLIPIPIKDIMFGTGLLDIGIGAFLIIHIFTGFVAAIAALHLAVILITAGINDITVRDIGLLAATIALTIIEWPRRLDSGTSPKLWPRRQ